MRHRAITTLLCLVLGVLLAPGAGYAAEAASTYVVRPGDTLTQIGLRYGVTAQTLASVNTLSDPSRLTPGQVLKIPRARAALGVPQAQPAASRATQPALLAVYWVRGGDTLYGIAGRYGVTADVLKEANGLWTDIIVPGQRLDIPARGSAAALGRVRSEDYYRMAKPVEAQAILPGDLVFFTTDSPGPSHVGIFIGEGKFIHASSTGSDVTISSLDDPHYGPGFLGVRRIVNLGN